MAAADGEICVAGFAAYGAAPLPRGRARGIVPMENRKILSGGLASEKCQPQREKRREHLL
jgi:hypothetical protein